MAGNTDRIVPLLSNGPLAQRDFDSVIPGLQREGNMPPPSDHTVPHGVRRSARHTRAGTARPQYALPRPRNASTTWPRQEEVESQEGSEAQENSEPDRRRRRTMPSDGSEHNAASRSEAAYPFAGLSATSAPAVQFAVAGPARLVIIDQARRSVIIQPQWDEAGGRWGCIIPEGAILQMFKPKNDAEHDLMISAAAAATHAGPCRSEQAPHLAEPRGAGVAASSPAGDGGRAFSRQITDPDLTGLTGRRAAMEAVAEQALKERTMQLD